MSRMHAFQSARTQQRSVAVHAHRRRAAASTSAGVALGIGSAVLLLTAGDPASAKGFFDEQNERNAAISKAESKLERLFEESQKQAKSAAGAAQQQVRFSARARRTRPLAEPRAPPRARPSLTRRAQTAALAQRCSPRRSSTCCADVGHQAVAQTALTVRRTMHAAAHPASPHTLRCPRPPACPSAARRTCQTP